MTENEIASGISASATTRPARNSVRKTLGESQTGRDIARVGKRNLSLLYAEGDRHCGPAGQLYEPRVSSN
ncbi:hypothetical protein GCM10010353_12000 [Streptomyces chryseus]|nr:hypothetical protein GCM10010353_12000 [Streptomyces chryseus]